MLETVFMTMGLGIIAKFVEFKLDKHISFEKEWVGVEELTPKPMLSEDVEVF